MCTEQETLRCQVTGVVVSGHCMPARIDLRYEPEDPFAVTLRIKSSHPCGGPAREWRLDRDLLAQGLSASAGETYVRIRPVSSDWVLLDLATRAEPVLLILAITDLRAFLSESFRKIGPGHENDAIDWDLLLLHTDS